MPVAGFAVRLFVRFNSDGAFLTNLSGMGEKNARDAWEFICGK
jgi:hypothetical protein